MQVDSFKLNTHLSRGRVVATLVLLVFLALPVSAFAEEQESIAALRQMGKAFTSIAEKASSAVVAIKVERTVSRQYLTPREWPFRNPFEDDPFDPFRRRSPRQRSPQRSFACRISKRVRRGQPTMSTGCGDRRTVTRSPSRSSIPSCPSIVIVAPPPSV